MTPPSHLLTVWNPSYAEREVRQALRQDARWVLGRLPHELEPLLDLRNPAAHDRTVSRHSIARPRERVLGIGWEGLVCRIARTKLRAGR